MVNRQQWFRNGRKPLKKTLVALAVVGLFAAAAPAPASAQGTLFSLGPALNNSFGFGNKTASYGNRVFNILNPGGQNTTGVDDFVPPQSRPTINRVSRVVYGVSGISRVSRFFGIF